MTQANQKPLQTSFVYGLVSGVALGVSEMTLVFLLPLAPYPLAIFMGRLTLVLLVLAYLFAGYQAARRVGNLFAGTLAGALTGAFGVATVAFVVYVMSFLGIGFILNPDLFSIPIDLTFVAPLASPLVRIALTFALYGAIVGTLGGFVGKQRAVY